MEITGIKYIGPIFDNSGYAQACRGNIMALYNKGIPLTLAPISFEAARPGLGKNGEILKSLIDKKIDYNVVFIHTTPEFWQKYREKDKVNVGYTIWETTKLHPDWPGYINENVDKVLVGCSWNKEVFEESGVTIPIGVVPHGIDMSEFNGIKEYDVRGVEKDTYMFYSILQWTERKHPLSMVKAYWHAFQNNENVALVLKTYRSDYSEPEKDAIRTTIKRLKAVTPMERYPKIYLILNLLSNEEILGLHARGDCYISFDRGEGFGLSPFTAGACGNPIIVTGFGGSTEYAKEDNSYLVNYSLTPVFGMPWCMSLESLVKTTEGFKRACDLRSGMSVVNKNLQIKQINKVEFRPLLEHEDVYTLKCFSCPEKLELTGEHKLYVLGENNVPVRKAVVDINVGDYLYIPKPTINSQQPIQYRDDKSAIHPIQTDLLSKLSYLSGLYIAEGYIHRHYSYVSFSFRINEKNTLGKICKDYMKDIFSIKDDNIYERDMLDRNGYEVMFNDANAAKFFKKNFGSGSHEKFISPIIKFNPCNKDLLRGYWDGDGHIRKEGYKNKKTGKKRISPECIAETASLELVMCVRDVLLSLGIVPSLRKSERVDGRISYIISVSDEKFDAILGINNANRISSRFKKDSSDGGFGVLVTGKELLEASNEFICSISVEPDDDEDIINGGSYILNGIASSNSPWYRGDQLWAEPDVKHASDLMKHVYEDQEEAAARGQKIKEYIADNFTWEHIGNKIVKEIEEL